MALESKKKGFIRPKKKTFNAKNKRRPVKVNSEGEESEEESNDDEHFEMIEGTGF